MDRASQAVTDPGAAMDAVRFAERERRNSPAFLFDRLNDLHAYHAAAAMVQQQILAQSHKFVSGEYRADCKRRLERHATACKSVRRRMEQLTKRGVL